MAKTTARVRHLRDRGGRYFARVAVPTPLQKIVGKIELLEPLGPDRRDAIFRLPASVARFNQIIADAKRGLPPALPSVSIPHAAHNLYRSEIEQDQFARFSGLDGVQTPAMYREVFGAPYAFALRKVASGLLSKEDISGGFVDATIGWAIDDATAGKERPAHGSKAWIDLAKALASTRLEGLDRSRERDQGDFAGKPALAMLTAPPPTPELEIAPISIEGLFERYIAKLKRDNGGHVAEKAWKPAFRSLIAHLGHDDAHKVTKSDIRAWIETLHATLAGKTIKDKYLGPLKTIITDAFDHDIIPTNPTHGVRLKVSKPEQGRDKGFTEEEASAIIRASRSYQPKHSDNPQTRESEALTAAKRWTPLLCAHTGARISEMTQLRKSDVRTVDGIHHIRITPDAGSVKTRQFRDVPLHPQIIDAGFLDFVAASPDGPLFFRLSEKREGATHQSKTVSGRLSQWLQSLGLIPDGLQPNHAWRHRLKTLGNELEITARTIDAIQGHAPRTAGEGYGSVPLKVRAKAIGQFPAISAK